MAHRNNEAYRKAALALANASRQTRCRSAMFSSALAGEGTTTAAVSIGRQLLQDLGFKPVVIELNRVRPALARLFRLDNRRSLASVASGSVTVIESVQKDPTGLCMIPAGKFESEDGIPGLESVLCRAVQELQNRFDYILIDTAPVLESADVLIAGRVVPHAILVVGAGRASQEAVREACRELGDARIQLVGTILNARKRIIPRWLDRWMVR